MKNKFQINIFLLISILVYCQKKSQKKDVIEMNNKMKIEIWSDIMCPFCYIGKRNFETALSEFSKKDFVEVEWKSFQLDPTIPEIPEYKNDIYTFIADRKGISYEKSKEMHENVVQYARSVGLDYDFEKTHITNSLKGHRLIQYAKTKKLGDQAEERLFYAYFTEGKNISNEETLVELGKEIGLTELEVNEALTNPVYEKNVVKESKEAQNLGLNGVPFFVINQKYAIMGAQQPNEILQTLDKAFIDWEKQNTNSLKVEVGDSCSVDQEYK